MLVDAGEPGGVLGVEHAVHGVTDVVGEVTAPGVLKGPEGVMGVKGPDNQAVLVGEQVSFLYHNIQHVFFVAAGS